MSASRRIVTSVAAHMARTKQTKRKPRDQRDGKGKWKVCTAQFVCDILSIHPRPSKVVVYAKANLSFVRFFFSTREPSGEERRLTEKKTESRGKGIRTLSGRTLFSKSTIRYGLSCLFKRTCRARLPKSSYARQLTWVGFRIGSLGRLYMFWPK